MRPVSLALLALAGCGGGPASIQQCEALAEQFCDAAHACAAGVALPSDAYGGEACAYEGRSVGASGTVESIGVRFGTRELCLAGVEAAYGCLERQARVSADCGDAIGATRCEPGDLGPYLVVGNDCNPDCVQGAFECG